MFLVIDGSSMLSSNYYGSLPNEMKFAKTDEQKRNALKLLMQTSAGIYTNGVYTSLRMILDIIHDFPEITHMCIVFDRSRNTFRRQIDPNYKAQRKPTPNPLSQQFATLSNILSQIGLIVMSDENFEADDIAGSVIKTFKNQTDMIFLTKDHDYLQLLDEHVKGWMVQTTQAKANEIMLNANVDTSTLHIPSKIAWFDDSVCLSVEGVKPHQIPDKKGLCGDVSDNIKGVAGVGPKAVIPLLSYYESIEDLYNDINSCNSEITAELLSKKWQEKCGLKRSPYKKLAGNKDIALESKLLATIKTDIPVPDNLDEYKIHIDQTELQNVIQTYEFNSLISRNWENPE